MILAWMAFSAPSIMAAAALGSWVKLICTFEVSASSFSSATGSGAVLAGIGTGAGLAWTGIGAGLILTGSATGAGLGAGAATGCGAGLGAGAATGCGAGLGAGAATGCGAGLGAGAATGCGAGLAGIGTGAGLCCCLAGRLCLVNCCLTATLPSWSRVAADPRAMMRADEKMDFIVVYVTF